MATEVDGIETLGLIRKAQKGDKKALNVLFQKFNPFVEKIISILLGFDSISEADDYVQECLLKAYQSLSTFKTEDGDRNFRAFLRACARSVILDDKKKWKRIKRGGRREKPLSDYGSTYLSTSILPAAPGKTPSEIAISREQDELLAKALRELPDHKRQVILLHDFCECSFQEIAARLRIRSDQTVKQVYYRAREDLKKILHDKDEPPAS